jgi:hypothetical protein
MTHMKVQLSLDSGCKCPLLDVPLHDGAILDDVFFTYTYVKFCNLTTPFPISMHKIAYLSFCNEYAQDYPLFLSLYCL